MFRRSHTECKNAKTEVNGIFLKLFAYLLAQGILSKEIGDYG